MDKTDHIHCENCFKYNCTTSKTCKMVYCKFECGCRFHECKSKEHSFLCDKDIVPCPNTSYGCPVKVKRGRISQHLEMCPASIVFCTMQWNRYPLYSKSRLSWVPFYQPNPVLVKGHLDVELALRDQRVLQDMFKKRLRKGKAKVDILRTNYITCEKDQTTDIDRQVDTRQIDMAVALSALEHNLKPLKLNTEAVKDDENSLDNSFSMKMKLEEINVSNFESESEMSRPDSPRAALLCENIDSSTGSASHGAHDAPEKHRYAKNRPSDKRNVNEVGKILRQCLENNKGQIRGEAVDKELTDISYVTVENNRDSDCSQSANTYDRLLAEDQESETKTPTPPLFANIYLEQPLGLNVMLETLPKFQKQAPLYSIPCNQVLRRSEYGFHFKNVHSEIHGGLNGWVEHRCPLAQYGCTYVHHRLLPNNQHGKVTFDKDLGSFGVKYSPLNSKDSHSCITMETDYDVFSNLPLEILETIASKLDGFSLCQLSCTSKLMRQVCQRILEKNGLVSLEWEKRIYDNGTWSWQVRQKKWFFSTAFSPIKNWVHSSHPGMSSHLEKCPYFKRYVPLDKFSYQSSNGLPGNGVMDESSDKELEIDRQWQELCELAGLY